MTERAVCNMQQYHYFLRYFQTIKEALIISKKTSITYCDTFSSHSEPLSDCDLGPRDVTGLGLLTTRLVSCGKQRPAVVAQIICPWFWFMTCGDCLILMASMTCIV